MTRVPISVTRWPNFLIINWPFTRKKICPKACKIVEVGLKFPQNEKFCQFRSHWCQFIFMVKTHLAPFCRKIIRQLVAFCRLGTAKSSFAVLVPEVRSRRSRRPSPSSAQRHDDAYDKGRDWVSHGAL